MYLCKVKLCYSISVAHMSKCMQVGDTHLTKPYIYFALQPQMRTVYTLILYNIKQEKQLEHTVGGPSESEDVQHNT